MVQRPEPIPEWIRRLPGLAYCAVGGAAFGLLCGFLILALGAFSGPSHGMNDNEIINSAFNLAARRGAVLGAVSMPIAYAIIWPKGKVWNALIVVAVATIACGFIGFALGGPNGPISLAASIGFWFSLVAMERARTRGFRDSGFGGYFK